MRVGAPHALRQEVDEARFVVPAVDESELRLARKRGFELVPVAADRQVGVVRGEDESDNRVGASCQCASPCIGDPGRPVLHPGEDGDIPELALERRARLFGDRIQGRAILDPEPPVTLDEILEQLRTNRPPAADVAVVLRHVGESLRRAVSHQDDSSTHGAEARAHACGSEPQAVERAGRPSISCGSYARKRPSGSEPQSPRRASRPSLRGRAP